MKKPLVLLAGVCLCLAVLAGCKSNNRTPFTKTEPNAAVPRTVEADKTLLDIEFDVGETYSQNVYITNGTGVAIVEMYISRSDVDVWEDELLHGTIFPNNDTKMFVTDISGTASTTWDICYVDEDGDEVYFFELNLSSATELRLHWGDGQTPSITVTQSNGRQYIEEGWYEETDLPGVKGYAYYNQNLRITNKTGVAILEVYISLSEDNSWGPDLLDGRVFTADDVMYFTTERLAAANTTWDIRIVDEDGDVSIFDNVVFSRASGITISWGYDGYTPMVSYDD